MTREIADTKGVVIIETATMKETTNRVEVNDTEESESKTLWQTTPIFRRKEITKIQEWTKMETCFSGMASSGFLAFLTKSLTRPF